MLQGLLCACERVRVNGGTHVIASRALEELAAVATGVGRDAAQFLLVEQLALVVQRRGIGPGAARPPQAPPPGRGPAPAPPRVADRAGQEPPGQRARPPVVSGAR